MTIGVLRLDLLIPMSRSLKDKQRALKGIKDRLRNRYNCSVAEVEYKDSWGRARLAVCVIGDDSRFVNTQLDEIAHFACQQRQVEVADYGIELL